MHKSPVNNGISTTNLNCLQNGGSLGFSFSPAKKRRQLPGSRRCVLGTWHLLMFWALTVPRCWSPGSVFMGFFSPGAVSSENAVKKRVPFEKYTLQETSPYPTKREVWKIIDSTCPFLGGICDRSLEGILPSYLGIIAISEYKTSLLLTYQYNGMSQEFWWLLNWK